jgi:uncharacterized membrane protein
VNNWKVIPTIVLATVLIFGAGVVTGGVLVNYVKQARPRLGAKRPLPAPPPVPAVTNDLAGVSSHAPNPPQILSKEFLKRLELDLQLTKDQQETIQKIISDNQNLMRKVVQDARLEIREALAPEQRTQFDEIIKRPFHKPLFATNAPTAVLPAAPPTTPTPPPPAANPP